MPVIVHLPDTIVRSAGRTSANSYTVFVIFGVILGVLSIVIIALVVHIQKRWVRRIGLNRREEKNCFELKLKTL